MVCFLELSRILQHHTTLVAPKWRVETSDVTQKQVIYVNIRLHLTYGKNVLVFCYEKCPFNSGVMTQAAAIEVLWCSVLHTGKWHGIVYPSSSYCSVHNPHFP